MSLTCAAPPPMALRLAHARSVPRPSRHALYVGRLSRKREELEKEDQARLDQLCCSFLCQCLPGLRRVLPEHGADAPQVPKLSSTPVRLSHSVRSIQAYY